MGLLQRQDFKTESELVALGSSKSAGLLDDTFIYIARTQVAETLDDAIETNKLFTFKEISTPSSPPSGYHMIYPKSDGIFYKKGNDGVERVLGGTGLVSAKSANFTAAASYIYLIDCSGGTISVQLPTPAANLSFKIKDIKGTANTYNISLIRAASEKIDNVAATYTFNSNYFAAEIVSDGTNWYIL